MKSYSPKKSQLVDSRHFTLIELLITIAIIAILAAMLLPALNMARDKSKAIKCVSNMKQTLSALYLYADDYAELLPLAYFSEASFPGYGNKAWGLLLQETGYLFKPASAQCPSAKARTSGWGDTLGFVNGHDNYRSKYSIKLSTISSKASPSRFGLLIDTIRITAGVDFAHQKYVLQPSFGNYVHLRHGKRANVGFADGSAGAYAADDLNSLGDVCEEASQYDRTKMREPHATGNF